MLGLANPTPQKLQEPFWVRDLITPQPYWMDDSRTIVSKEKKKK